MTILRDTSTFAALLFRLMYILLLFDSRWTAGKTLIYTLCTLLPLTVINEIIYIWQGPQRYMTLLLLTLTIPSLIIMIFPARKRDGRFFFTICLVDTVVIEIADITSILEIYIPGDYIFMFLSRIVSYLILTYIIYKRIRPTYLEIQKNVAKGWYIYAATSMIFYILMSLLTSYPPAMTAHIEYISVMILLFLLIPLTYYHSFITLKNQLQMSEMRERDVLLTVQVNSITERIEQYTAADKLFRMERHNYRHKMQTIAGLIEKERFDDLHKLVIQYADATSESTVKKYCENAVIDAVLASYIQTAEAKAITVTAELDFPEKFSAPEAELAVVFANALENAIHACESLSPNERRIKIKVIKEPDFMFRISNQYNGTIEFDRNGIPVNNNEDHGYGIRSIIAFCGKHDAYYKFNVSNNIFSLTIGL